MQMMHRVARLRDSYVGTVFCTCVLVSVHWIAANGVSCQAQKSTQMTVAVSAFEVLGYSRNVVALRESAQHFTESLREKLAQDSLVHWLPDEPADRQRDSVTGHIPAVLYLVMGSLEEMASDSVVVKWRVLSVEDRRILASDSLATTRGNELDAVTEVAARIVSSIPSERLDDSPDSTNLRGTLSCSKDQPERKS